MTEKSESPHAVLEEAGVGFDPSTQHVELSKEEKRRTTAVMLAISAYRDFIIKEADYLREAASLAVTGNGPAIRPATVEGIMEMAIYFDTFIAEGPDAFSADDGEEDEKEGEAKSDD